MLSQTVLEYH